MKLLGIAIWWREHRPADKQGSRRMACWNGLGSHYEGRDPVASNGALVKESAPDPQGACWRKGSRARPYRTWGHCFAPRRSAIDEFDSTTYRLPRTLSDWRRS